MCIVRPEKNDARDSVTKKRALGISQGGLRWVPRPEPGGHSATVPSHFTWAFICVSKKELTGKLLPSMGSSAWCCHDLEGGEGLGGRSKTEGIYVYI